MNLDHFISEQSPASLRMGHPCLEELSIYQPLYGDAARKYRQLCRWCENCQLGYIIPRILSRTVLPTPVFNKIVFESAAEKSSGVGKYIKIFSRLFLPNPTTDFNWTSNCLVEQFAVSLVMDSFLSVSSVVCGFFEIINGNQKMPKRLAIKGLSDPCVVLF